MGNRIVAVILSGCLVAGGLSCGNQPLQTAGGTGSELIGKACYAGGPAAEPVADAAVYVFEESYLSDTSRTFRILILR